MKQNKKWIFAALAALLATGAVSIPPAIKASVCYNEAP